MSGRTGAGGGGKSQRTGESAGERQRREPRTLPEWITLAISSLVVLAIAGLVVYEQRAGEHEPAAFEVWPMPEDVRFEGDRYYIPVVALNTGDQTAEDVRIRITLSPTRQSAGEQGAQAGGSGGGAKGGDAGGPGGAGGGSGPESRDSTEEESSEFQIRYFTGGARFDAVAVFRQDPRKGELRVDIISYLEP